MKCLADMGVSPSTVRALRDSGYDVTHLQEFKQGHLGDAAILEKAKREGRVVLTFDLDFGDLLAAGCALLPSVIIFRLGDHRPASVTSRLLDILLQQERALNAGAIITVEDIRYRVRALPNQMRSE